MTKKTQKKKRAKTRRQKERDRGMNIANEKQARSDEDTAGFLRGAHGVGAPRGAGKVAAVFGSVESGVWQQGLELHSIAENGIPLKQSFSVRAGLACSSTPRMLKAVHFHTSMHPTLVFKVYKMYFIECLLQYHPFIFPTCKTCAPDAAKVLLAFKTIME
ncbi:hypothetical protein BDR06DRAFT_968267 [Suillus hirtellus]|nr:hypothetical protein BDR06DRAFT_968267 [Suillus hirtellus]